MQVGLAHLRLSSYLRQIYMLKNNLTFYVQREKFAIQEVQRLEERVPGASMSKDDDDLR